LLESYRQDRFLPFTLMEPVLLLKTAFALSLALTLVSTVYALRSDSQK